MASPEQLARIRQAITAFEFGRLFIEELGWDRLTAGQTVVTPDGRTFALAPIAQKRGLAVYRSAPMAGGAMPDYETRRQIDAALTKLVHEHLIIFVDGVDGKPNRQVWQRVTPRAGQRAAAYREFPYYRGQSGEDVAQRLSRLFVGMEEEEKLTLSDVTGRTRSAFDVERVTKRFYDGFQKEHAAFLETIEGIADDDARIWYASLTLNRLMFTYFIQDKGFLDGDSDYLRNRLARTRAVAGPDQFYSFFQAFLLRLFHEGLGQQKAERAADLAALIGDIPYLNGGLFERHEIERRYPTLNIPDAAFAQVFTFFDAWRWRLDDRPDHDDRVINPDVLGYIFEKYINQKQMGAYYTKEDITDYIGKNTILPWLLETAARLDAVAFEPQGEVWRLLQQDPDRYLYDAVRKGAEQPLPDAIAAGLADVAQRGGWNRAADPAMALPTETWRELVARRQRAEALRTRLADGAITTVNDLITENLDIRRFTQDVIVNCEGHHLLQALWRALTTVTVLDPTCGSGAFLFAALELLRPLYEACLDRMQAFVDEADQLGKRTLYEGSDEDPGFRNTLREVAKHPNRAYYVLKTIIVNNLFGVDIMEEATEIARLRLFLALVALVDDPRRLEPLPDIDFNIRAGNTLVGFTTLDAVRAAIQRGPNGAANVVAPKLMMDPQDEAALARINAGALAAARDYANYQALQTRLGVDPTALHAAKDDLRQRLAALNAELNRYLAREYRVDAADAAAFARWQTSHQPFHWFVEFYRIMHGGGFDVIIGNPPYVNAAKVRRVYSLRSYATEKCSDIYAAVLERCAHLVRDGGRTGMIVPLSLAFSGDFDAIRALLYRSYSHNWFSSFARIPSALFSADVRVRNTIQISVKGGVPAQNYTTVLHRWFGEARPILFSNLSYAPFKQALTRGLIPRYNSLALSEAFERLLARKGKTIEASMVPHSTGNTLRFKKSAYNWLAFGFDDPPCYGPDGESIPQNEFGPAPFLDERQRDLAFLFLNGRIMFSYWVLMGDDFHLAQWMFATFPIDLAAIPQGQQRELLTLVEPLNNAMQANISFKLNAGKRVGNYNLARCRDITDMSDAIFAEYLGLQEVWSDIELLCAQVIKTNFSDGANGDEGEGDE